MFRSLLSRIAFLRHSTPSRKPVSAARRSRPSLEVLEGRALPSASPLQAFVPAQQFLVQTNAVFHQTIPANLNVTQPIQTNLPNLNVTHPIYHPVFFHRVPDLTGLDFHLISANGRPAHDLAIKTEVRHFFTSSASFTGTWSGANGNDVNQVSNASLVYVNATTTSINFSWATNHALTGTVTWVAPGFQGHHYQFGHYHLEGDVTVGGIPGGPGHVSGNAYLPLFVHS